MSLTFDNVIKFFGTKQVLGSGNTGLSFVAKKGEITFLLGKSGSGKSVTLKCLVGMVSPDSGNINVDNVDVQTEDPKSLSVVRKKCGMIFQFPALFDSLSVFENIAFGLRAQNQKLNLPESEIKSCVHDSLEQVNLGAGGGFLEKLPSSLSFGEQKRVSIARTLALKPEYLLFDEPTTGLDPVNTRIIHELINELSKNLKVTSIVVSHDMRSALEFAHRIIVIDRGVLIEDANPQSITQSRNSLIKDFLSESKI